MDREQKRIWTTTRLSCRRGHGAFNTTRQYYFGVPRETSQGVNASRVVGVPPAQGGARCDEGAGSRLSDGRHLDCAAGKGDCGHGSVWSTQR